MAGDTMGINGMKRWRRYGAAVLLMLLASPVLQAAGERSPEAVAQGFATAYRQGDAEAIVALQFMSESTVQNRERKAWRRQMERLVLRSYRVANLLARDQQVVVGVVVPQHKLLVEYESQSGRERLAETYYIGQQAGLYYLLPVHDGQ